MAAATQFGVGLVGAGYISKFHVQALKRVPSARIVGVTDLDPVRARDLATACGATACDTPEELVRLGANVIHVLTPPASHCDITLAALRNGCHVFVEKPAAVTVEECDRMEEAAARAGRSVGVAHSLLWDPFVARALKWVRDGLIGEPLTVDYFRCQGPPAYAGGRLPDYFSEGGFPFRDLGIHALYLVEAFLGEVKDAQTRFVSTGRVPNLHLDEWRVGLECERGTAQIQMSWSVRPQQNLIVVQGTRGVIRVDLFGMSATLRRSGMLPEHVTRVINSVSEGTGMATQASVNLLRFLAGRLWQYHGLQACIAAFYRALADGERAPVTVSLARSAVRWMGEVAGRADQQRAEFIAGFPEPVRSRVLVTGASGFIGRALVRRLISEQQVVRILVRNGTPAEFAGNPDVETVVGDLGDPEAVDRAVRGVDLVYHLGAGMRGTASDFDRGTVVGTRNVVDSVLAHRVGRLVHMSSLSVLHAAAADANSVIREDWPLEPRPGDRGNYTRTKLDAERAVVDAVSSRGLNAIILRPGEVVGDGAPRLTAGLAQRAGRTLVVLGPGKVLMPMVHVEDVIDALQLAATRALPPGALFHIVDPTEVSQNGMIRRYIAASGVPYRILHLPVTVVYALAASVALLGRMLGRALPLSPYRVKSALAPRKFDCAAARDRLGWSPRHGLPK